MFPKRSPRLRTFDYAGPYRYSLTFCTAFRQAVFTDASIVQTVLAQLRQSAATHDFAILAYCFMPDHLHLLVEGTSEVADLRQFVRKAKQVSSHRYRLLKQRPLWQPGYYDRVLRDNEATVDVIRYLLENPVRAGIVTGIEEYRFCGSDLWDVTTLSEGVQRPT